MGVSFAGRIGTNMTRLFRNSIPALAAIGLVGLYVTNSKSQAPTTAEANLATVKQYCSGCHSDRLKTGGISLENITTASIAKDPDLFEKAVRKVRGRVMPPPNAKQPDGKTADALVEWLETSLDKVPTQAHITDQV